jgi:predicted transcriptional regulator
MARRASPRPTDAELAILQVLWREGPSTVRRVNEELSQQKPTGYTTTLKFMQIMTAKGLVTRDEVRRPHVYAPAHSSQKTQRQLLRDLLGRAFSGSVPKLVMELLASGKTTPTEIAEIKKLLDDFEGDEK